MKKLKIWEIADFIFISALGTLLHFTYDWSGKNDIISLFSAVNESTWEHLKLLFFPAMIFSIAEYIGTGKKFKGFFTSKATAIILGMISIVVLFYTYTGIIGKNFMFADILIFFIGAFVVSFISLKMIPLNRANDIIGIIIMILLAGSFFLFTFNPPDIAFFENPQL